MRILLQGSDFKQGRYALLQRISDETAGIDDGRIRILRQLRQPVPVFRKYSEHFLTVNGILVTPQRDKSDAEILFPRIIRCIFNYAFFLRHFQISLISVSVTIYYDLF